MIKLEQLQQFLQVSQCGSLIEAAEQLHRTPSAVSMTLKQLEIELGGALFEGDRKRDLTPLGHFVRERAEQSVALHQRTLADIKSYAQGDTGLVTIAAVPSAATQQLPEAIANCQSQRPGLRIELRDTDSGAVHTAVSDGTVDLGVASLPNAGSQLQHQLLRSDAFVCVCNKTHPLSTRTNPLPWSALQQHAFISNGLCEQITHPLVQVLNDQAQLRVHNIASLLAFVRKGLGITLLPHDSVPDDSGLCKLPLRDKSATRSLYLMRRTEQTASPAVLQLAAAITQQYQQKPAKN